MHCSGQMARAAVGGGVMKDRLVSSDFTLEILEDVSAIYRCVTKHPKFSGLKQ